MNIMGNTINNIVVISFQCMQMSNHSFVHIKPKEYYKSILFQFFKKSIEIPNNQLLYALRLIGYIIQQIL